MLVGKLSPEQLNALAALAQEKCKEGPQHVPAMGDLIRALSQFTTVQEPEATNGETEDNTPTQTHEGIGG